MGFWISLFIRKYCQQTENLFTMFSGIKCCKCCKLQCGLNINKFLSENIHNIERNTTLSFGVCQCCWSGETNSLPLNIGIFAMFSGIKWCKNQCKWNINKPLSKNLQNIERNKTLSFGVCQCCWSGETNSLPLNICIFAMFLAIKCCINQCKWNMNKPLSKNLQNIERNKTLSFGVCKCCWSGEKTFKDMNWVIKDTI